jgi:hypothetical protein
MDKFVRPGNLLGSAAQHALLSNVMHDSLPMMVQNPDSIARESTGHEVYGSSPVCNVGPQQPFMAKISVF